MKKIILFVTLAVSALSAHADTVKNPKEKSKSEFLLAYKAGKAGDDEGINRHCVRAGYYNVMSQMGRTTTFTGDEAASDVIHDAIMESAKSCISGVNVILNNGFQQ